MLFRNAIWDFDGTLYDTYPVMLAALEQVYAQYQVPVERQALYRLIKQQSIRVALQQLAQKLHIDYQQLDADYHRIEAQTQVQP